MYKLTTKFNNRMSNPILKGVFMKFTSLLSLALLLSFSSSNCMNTVKQVDEPEGKAQKLFEQEDTMPEAGQQSHFAELPEDDYIFRESKSTGGFKHTEHWAQIGGRFVRTKKEILEPVDYPQQTGFIPEGYIWQKTGSSYRRITGSTKISQFSSSDPILDEETKILIRAEQIKQKDIKTKKVSYIKDANGLEGLVVKWKEPKEFFKGCDSWQQRKATDSPDSFEPTGDFWKLQKYGLQKLDPALKRMELQHKPDSAVKTLEGNDAISDKETLEGFSQLAEDVRKLEIPQEELHRRIIYYAMLLNLLSTNNISSKAPTKNKVSVSLLQMRDLQNEAVQNNVSQIVHIQAVLKELSGRLDNDSKAKLPQFAKKIVEEAVSSTSDFQRKIDENAKTEAAAINDGKQSLQAQKEKRTEKMTTVGRFTKKIFG